jgi:hypothetical protein
MSTAPVFVLSEPTVQNLHRPSLLNAFNEFGAKNIFFVGQIAPEGGKNGLVLYP